MLKEIGVDIDSGTAAGTSATSVAECDRSVVTDSDTSVLSTQLVTTNGRQQNIIDGTGAQPTADSSASFQKGNPRDEDTEKTGRPDGNYSFELFDNSTENNTKQVYMFRVGTILFFIDSLLILIHDHPVDQH